MSTLCDFTNSYLTFTVPSRSNTARIQLDARCVLTDRSGATEEFFLITPCKSEFMYTDTAMFQEPNFDFCGIFSRTENVILRTFAVYQESDGRQHKWSRIDEMFDEVKIDIRPLRNTRPLTTDAEVYRATLDNLHLVARTYVTEEATGQSAMLEYPIKTMNVAEPTGRFQVDTGPLVIPLFGGEGATQIERMAMAFVVYNKFEYAEFIVREVTPVDPANPAGARVTHYSGHLALPARHELFAVDAV